MKQFDICPYCEKEREINIIEKLETRTIRGDEITATIKVCKCTKCENEFTDYNLEKSNLRSLRDKYRELHAVITPEEIKLLREKYDISQKTLSTLLAFSELTINSYEQGAIPDSAHQNILHLLSDPVVFRKLYIANKDNISPLRRKKIEQRLSEIFQDSECGDIIFYDDLFQSNKQPSEYTGFRKPDIERLISLFQVLLISVGKTILKTCMLKMLFYCDFYCFKKLVKSISGWEYARLPLGPVPNNYSFVIGIGQKRNCFEVEESLVGPYYCELFKLSADIDPIAIKQSFTLDEIGIIQTVVDILKDKTAKELVEMSHREEAYIQTEPTRIISYSHALNLTAF